MPEVYRPVRVEFEPRCPCLARWNLREFPVVITGLPEPAPTLWRGILLVGMCHDNTCAPIGHRAQRSLLHFRRRGPEFIGAIEAYLADNRRPQLTRPVQVRESVADASDLIAGTHSRRR